MKSIREWRQERGIEEAAGTDQPMRPMGSADTFHAFSRNALKNTMGSGVVDPTIKLKLRSRILDLSKEFPQMSQAQLFQSIMSVVGQLLTHGSGGKVTAGGLYNKLNNGMPQDQKSNNSEVMK